MVTIDKIIRPVTREEKILSGEDLQPRTRMEYFLKQASAQTSGSSLPEYVDADENKGMMLKHVVEETVLVPEQSITFSNGIAELTTVNFEATDLKVGMTATATFSYYINNQYIKSSVESEVVEDETYGLVWTDANRFSMLYYDRDAEKWMIAADMPDGQYTGSFIAKNDKGIIPAWSDLPGGFTVLHDTNGSLGKSFNELSYELNTLGKNAMLVVEYNLNTGNYWSVFTLSELRILSGPTYYAEFANVGGNRNSIAYSSDDANGVLEYHQSEAIYV